MGKFWRGAYSILGFGSWHHFGTLFPVEKIGFDSIISICPANKLNYIITDSDSSEDDLMQFEELGVKIKITE